MKLSVVVPVYNEEQTIEKIIEQIRSAVLPEPITLEILIINDGSTDNTRKILEKYQEDQCLRIFNLDKNIGKTSALVEGIKNAIGDIILIQDADLEYNPSEYPKLIEPIIGNRAAVVYGSRFIGDIKEMKFINRFSNNVSNWAFNLLYPARITDINTGYKVFKKDIIRSIDITSTDFTFETEVTAKLVNRGIEILEVPINYVARTKEAGKKINWLNACKMFWGIVKFRNEK